MCFGEDEVSIHHELLMYKRYQQKYCT